MPSLSTLRNWLSPAPRAEPSLESWWTLAACPAMLLLLGIAGRSPRPRAATAFLCSGDLGSAQLQTLVQDEQLSFLAKPFSTEELAAKADELRLAPVPAEARA